MILRLDVVYAKENWSRWWDVFEHDQSYQSNPLLGSNPRLKGRKDGEDFEQFLKEYSVGRTIRHDEHQNFRRWLASADFPLDSMLQDKSGEILDRQLRLLAPRFGSNGRPISALSKIASFLAPGCFIAWDDFARKGLDIAFKHVPGNSFRDYATYKAKIDQLMDGETGHAVRNACLNNYPSDYAQVGDKFHLHVLDTCLMRLGGRNFGAASGRLRTYRTPPPRPDRICPPTAALPG